MFIVLSGSTCVGKSTIGKLLTSQCVDTGMDMAFFNESSIHSEALLLMFREPENHTFIVQCEFVIRRTTLLLEALRSHEHVVIERYIDDDRLFEEYWLAKGMLSDTQHELYQRLWQECRGVLPKPDCTVFIRSDVEKATSRLIEREHLAGEAREVPENFVRQYVMELSACYENFVARGVIQPDLVMSSDKDTAHDLVQRILQRIPSTNLLRNLGKA